jgi:hypothetical protein
LPLKVVNELRSNIYLVLSEKLAINTDPSDQDIELVKMFSSDVATKIDSQAYLNLKFISVFFNLFLEITKNIESSIYFNKVKTLKSLKGKYDFKINK